MAGGSWETPAPQPLQNGDSSMVSVFHQMSRPLSENHPLILPFHEAQYSIQQPRRTVLRRVPRRCRASPGSRPYDELFAPPPRGGPQSGCLF
jgi:hypothetical protein